MEDDEVEDGDVKGEEEDDVDNDDVEEEEEDDDTEEEEGEEEEEEEEENRSADRGARFARAFSVEMHLEMSQEPLYTEIDR